MTYKYRCLLVCALLLVGFDASSQESAGLHKDPQAIAILEKADAAIRNLRAIKYRAHYLGGYTFRGRMSAEVVLRRESGSDEEMGTIAYSARIEMAAKDAPYAQEHLPDRYTLIDTAQQTLLIDPAAQTIRKAAGQDRMGLNYGGLVSATLPQYLRPEPFQFEIEDSLAADYLGTTELNGQEHHIVWLKFDEISSGGFGEQFLYFGVEDHLIRKATLVAPRVALPRREGDTADSPVRTYPTMFIELTLSDLEVLPGAPDSLFAIADDGYRVVLTSSKPAVGTPGPDWTLPLPGGGTISSAALRGNVALLFFWASWCPTCHSYFPEIQKIHETWPDRVQVLAINAFDRDDAMAYIREHGYSFDVALDGDDLLANQFGFIGQPAVVLLDRDGVIRYRKLGRGDDALLPLIEALVE